MQVQKDFVRKHIIRIAKWQFMEKGFQKSSMRSIAKEMGATTGTLYSYFQNKDELFYAVVEPALLFSTKRLEDIRNLDLFKYDLRLTQDIMLKNNYFVLSPMVNLFQEELHIIFFKASGSLVQSRMEEIVNGRAQVYFENLLEMERNGDKLKHEVDQNFLRLPVKLLFEIIKDMVKEKKTEAELREYESQAFPFLCAAWRSIFD